VTEIDHVEVSDGVQILTDDDESRSQSLKSSRQLILRLEGTFLETGSERVPVEPAEAIVRRPVVRRGVDQLARLGLEHILARARSDIHSRREEEGGESGALEGQVCSDRKREYRNAATANGVAVNIR